eukprot:1778370-Lingulodinium_polyedra.AAC.1
MSFVSGRGGCVRFPACQAHVSRRSCALRGGCVVASVRGRASDCVCCPAIQLTPAQARARCQW